VFPAEQLAAVMANRKDAPLLTNILMERDLSAVQERYVEAGYPAAKTGPVSVSFRHGRALVEIAVSEGPKVAVSFSGTDAFCSEHFPDLFDRGPDSDRLFTVMEERCAEHFRNLLLIWSEHDVSDTVIESSADKIRTAYRESGYADAKVDVRLMEGPGFLDISFAVHEGPRVVVDRVQVEGTTVFTEKEIRNMIGTRASGWFSPHPFRQDILEGDAEAIADQYAAAGYHETVVKPRVTRAGDGSRAVVTLAITEGARTMTGSVTFDGNGIFTNEELMNAIMLKPGTPFGERLVDEDRYRILSLYATKGYLYARVEAERTMAPHAEPGAQGTVDVRFKIEEDRQVVIGTVILRGNVTTSDRVILRELRPRTGEPYRYETLLSSQQRIYRYGYFSLAKFEPVSPNAKEYIKDMLFTVEERPAGAVEFGVGYGDLDQLRGFAEVSHRNLWGAAHYASLRLEGSDILYRTAFTYQQPWFLGVRNLDSKLLLAWSDSKRINQDTREIYYQTEKTTASYGAERTWNGFKASLTYQFENVKNYNVQPAAELSPEDSGRVLISSLNPAIVYDLRDDPFNPRRGSVHGANVKEALSSLGSEAGFTKATLQTTWFIPATGVSVLALSGRAGMAWPHRNTLEVPIHERFYLGGSTTVRGYTQDSIGPGRLDASGDVIPTGGSSMVQLNAEVRLMAGGGSGFVLFTDAGNVWVDQHIRLDDLRASFGAGFRYHTPVGPLRIDYGQKINRRPGESPGELHFNIGHAF
jgi:outer membrane protein insertion porin family